jgi:ABC-type nitrate/sulfonate/bicarbonate transport system permease component
MHLFKLRQPASIPRRVIAGGLCLVLIMLLWQMLTRGRVEDRVLPMVSSPAETINSFHELWFDRELSRNTIVSLWRIVKGFGLAALIGVPIGIICGTWPIVNAFLAPVTVFGKNVPMSAMVPLTLIWFGTDERQKVMFLFIACVAFVVLDSARAIKDVHEQYVQSALTLGASKPQVTLKVLIPLALPDIYASLRLLFGLAFGYIILAELVQSPDDLGGLGKLIDNSQRIGPREHIYIILMLIALMAYVLDRILQFVQSKLFAYREEEA